MPKVLFLQPSYAHYRYEIFKLLTEQLDIKYIFTSAKNTYPGEAKPDMLPHVTIDSPTLVTPLLLFVNLIRENPDVVVTSCSSSMRTLVTYIYSVLFRKKMILWILEWKKQDIEGIGIKNLFRKLRFSVEKYMIRVCDALVVAGTASYEYALVLEKKETDIFKAPQCSNDITKIDTDKDICKQERHVFIYLSRILDWKCLDILLEAFSRLEKDRDDIFLLVVGDGPVKQEYFSLSKTLNLVNIEFTGNANPEHIGHYLSQSDVFILPSCFRGNMYEAWGLVINEAMSMGLPIITTKAVGASYDLVEDYKNGLIVEAGSNRKLYEAMSRILELDLKKMGRRSREIFEEKNDFKSMAQGFVNAINHVSAK